MRPMEFQVCRRARESRWVVILGNSLYRGNLLYGTYLDKEQALLDAVDAARDAVQAGCEAQVWLKIDRLQRGYSSQSGNQAASAAVVVQSARRGSIASADTVTVE